MGLAYGFINIMPYGNSVPLRKNVANFPLNIDGWKGQMIFQKIEELPFHTNNHLYRQYISSKDVTITLYIGYWGKFRHDSNVFSGRHLSPGRLWDITADKNSFLEFKGKRISTKELIYAKGDYKISLTYLYLTNYGPTTKRFKGRLINGIDAILNRKTNIALIKILSKPYSIEETDQIFTAQKEFLEKIYPVLKEFLPFKR